jgi:hypothetical protein
VRTLLYCSSQVPRSDRVGIASGGTECRQQVVTKSGWRTRAGHCEVTGSFRFNRSPGEISGRSAARLSSRFALLGSNSEFECYPELKKKKGPARGPFLSFGAPGEIDSDRLRAIFTPSGRLRRLKR